MAPAKPPSPEMVARQQTPCVICGATPTLAFSYAGVQGLTGRVCATHAVEADEAGYGVASDVGGVRNWS